MARIVSLGIATQDTYLLDRDDFSFVQVADHTIFKNLEIGKKIDIDQISFQTGGGGTNSAVCFSRNDHESILLSNIAHDTAGEAILATLDKEGVDTSYLQFCNQKQTSHSTILLDLKSGERTTLNYQGVSSDFSNFNESDLELIQPDWLYLTNLNGDLKTIARFLIKAKELNCKVMINPGELELKQKTNFLKLLKLVDILLVNKKEAATLVPGKIFPEFLSRLKNYLKTVIITDGIMGGIATNSIETYRFGIYEDVRVKDLSGAGDAFGSGFLSYFANNHSFKDSLIFASANSTSVIKELGANTGLLTNRESLHPMPIQEIK